MEQPVGPRADRPKTAPARVVIDATGPPVLNEAAAEVLLRILLRAAGRHGLTNVTHPDDRPVRSDS
jgi:hypothetical protein